MSPLSSLQMLPYTPRCSPSDDWCKKVGVLSGLHSDSSQDRISTSFLLPAPSLSLLVSPSACLPSYYVVDEGVFLKTPVLMASVLLA